SYEKELRKAKDIALEEMMEQARALGATAILGVDVDYQEISMGNGGGMLMVAATGTAVLLD
ncbi:MAG TPA: heavy metal-binding domain-containing protein, partial [Gemmatimonadaceae bacterium]|nr:heavy metal-binding domain-containing protein [Gemmatimonadaceae bacterium]